MQLSLSHPYFEYDIRGLLISFHPWEQFGTDPGSDDPDVLRIDYTARSETETEADVFYRDGGYSASKKIVFDPRDPSAAKRYVLRELYPLLSEATGKTLPWGTLSGIRPTKIPMKLRSLGRSDGEIVSYMTEELLISREKAELALSIAKREESVLSRISPSDGYSLYIDIPFCPTRCLYCSFTSYPVSVGQSRIDEYIESLLKEIRFTAEYFRGKKLQTIYFGGGTPTAIPADSLKRLFDAVTADFDLSGLLEWTVEAGRPDSISEEKLRMMKEYPVSRISINPQTMKQETLDLIGREHTVTEFVDKFRLARSMGFDNINTDLILGLPGESVSDVADTIRRIGEMAPESVTVHSLALKRASRLNREKELFRGSMLDSPEEAMAVCRETLASKGLSPYYLYRQKNMAGNLENTGFSKPGKEGIYNILIMEEVQSIVALGLGATSKRVREDLITRSDNVRDLRLYSEQIDEMIERKRKLFS